VSEPHASPCNAPTSIVPARRTLVGVCAAVFVGSLIGASAELHARSSAAHAWPLATGAALVLLALALATSFGARRRIVSAAALALIGCGAAWRASANTPRPDSIDRALGASVSAERSGVWSTSGSFGDEMRGSIEGLAERYDLPDSVVDDGDSVEILGCETSRRWPRGPELGPSAASGIAHPASRVLPDAIVRVAPPRDGISRRVSACIGSWRDRLLARCGALRDPLSRALVKALLFGDMTEMPREISELFVRVGTYHVLAISGSQVGLVAVLILWPLARVLAAALRHASFGRFALAPEIFHVVLLLVFVPIAGAGAPVLRSALSYALGACAPRAPMRHAFAEVGGRKLRLGRKADSLSLWSLALTAECLLHANAPLAVSVQLSYGATLGLILGTGPIARWMRELLPGGARIAPADALGRARSSWWRVPVQRSLDVGLYGLAASCAAVLATLPFVWARFGEWSPIGILATPALGLPVALVVALGWSWLCVPWAIPEVLIDWPSHAMIHEMRFFDLCPGSPDPLAPRPFVLLALATALAFAWLARSRSVAHVDGDAEHESRRGVILGRFALAIWAALLVPWTLAPRAFELWALDVGHGTSVVLRAPGSDTWIFDAGSRDRPDVAREALLPLLRRWEVGAVSVVLSHTDRDHDGALPYVIERYPPRVWAGALPAQCAERLPHTTIVADAGPGRIELPALENRGDVLDLELWRGSLREGNEGSRSLFVRYGAQTMLLGGDAVAEGLAEMIRRAHADDRVRNPLRLLLFPHHGSATDQLSELLASMRPQEIWISASGSPVALPELERRRLVVRTTAECGPLHLELSADRASREAMP
jgi:competence protein ComEC